MADTVEDAADDLDGETFQVGAGLSKEAEFKRLTGEDWPGVNYIAESNGAESGDDDVLETWVIRKRTSKEKTNKGTSEQDNIDITENTTEQDDAVTEKIAELEKENEELRNRLDELNTKLKELIEENETTIDGISRGPAIKSAKFISRKDYNKGIKRGPAFKTARFVPKTTDTVEPDDSAIPVLTGDIDPGNDPDRGDPIPDPNTVQREGKKNRAFKALIASIIGVVALSAIFSRIGNSSKKTDEQSPKTATESVDNNHTEVDTGIDFGEQPDFNPYEFMNQYLGHEEANPHAGELPNGVKYDLSHYLDREGKESYNAYDYNYDYVFDDREKTEEGINEVASRTPEALSTYVWGLFSDDEKAELGIKNMSQTELDDYFDENPDGGVLQNKCWAKLAEILGSGETDYNWYYENGTEATNYIYFVDKNGDGVVNDPTELKIGYDKRKRNNAPQVRITRRTIKNARGNNISIDLNLQCGFQPNYEQAPPADVPYVPSKTNEKVTPTPTPTDEPTPTPTKTPEKTTTPTPTPNLSKDKANTTRIDNKIFQDISNDTHSGNTKTTPNSGVKPEDRTNASTKNDYDGGAQANIVKNDGSINKEQVQNKIEIDYSENRGGANAANSAANPVRENKEAQKAANAAEIPIEQAPSNSSEIEDYLAGLGL